MDFVKKLASGELKIDDESEVGVLKASISCLNEVLLDSLDCIHLHIVCLFV